MDPPYGSITYTIGVRGSRIGGFHFWDPPRALGTSKQAALARSVLLLKCRSSGLDVGAFEPVPAGGGCTMATYRSQYEGDTTNPVLDRILVFLRSFGAL